MFLFSSPFTGLRLSKSSWDNIEEILLILNPLASLTSQLQHEKLTVSSFFEYWTLAKAKLKILAKTSNKSKQMIECFEAREKKIFENEIILAGAFLDPRLKSLLTDDQRNVAKEVIHQVYNKKNILTEKIQNQINLNVSDDKNETLSEDQKLLQSAIGSTKNLQSSESTINTQSQSKLLEMELGQYQNISLPIEADVHKFWKQNQFNEMSTVALDIIYVPVTEVSVERLFSHLNFILNDFRFKLDEKLIECILLLRMNKKFQ